MSDGNFEGGAPSTSAPIAPVVDTPAVQPPPSNEVSVEQEATKRWTPPNLDDIPEMKNAKKLGDKETSTDYAAFKKRDKDGSLIHVDLSGMTDEQKEKIDGIDTYYEFGGQTAYHDFATWAASEKVGLYEERKSEGGQTIGFLPKEGVSVKDAFDRFLIESDKGKAIVASKTTEVEKQRVRQEADGEFLEGIEKAVEDRNLGEFTRLYRERIQNVLRDGGLSDQEVEEIFSSQNAFVQTLREIASKGDQDTEEKPTDDGVKKEPKTPLEKLLAGGDEGRLKKLRKKLGELDFSAATNFGESIAAAIENEMDLGILIDYFCTGRYYDKIAKSLGYKSKEELGTKGIGPSEIEDYTKRDPKKELLLLAKGLEEARIISEEEYRTYLESDSAEILKSEEFRKKLSNISKENKHKFDEGIVKEMNRLGHEISREGFAYLMMIPENVKNLGGNQTKNEEHEQE
ncbi:MAG TPA: hypothetical protein DCX25_04260 [Candidatus Pacebacteria bacterium]|nr:hypothetical protein [Candidatus Paceibacterota bacterium]